MASQILSSASLAGSGPLNPASIPLAQKAAYEKSLQALVQSAFKNFSLKPGSYSYQLLISRDKGVWIQFKKEEEPSNGKEPWYKICKMSDLIHSDEHRALQDTLLKMEQVGIKYQPQFFEPHSSESTTLASRERLLAQEPTTHPKCFEQLGVPIDINSFFRNVGNILVAVKDSSSAIASAAATLTTVILYSELAGGMAAIPSGLAAFGKSGRKAALAFENKDWEGVFQEGNMSFGGLSYAALGAGMMIESAATLAGSSSLGAVGGAISSWAGIPMGTALLIYAMNGMRITHDFREQLHSIISKTPKDSDMLHVAEWIQKQVSLTPLELQEIQVSSKGDKSIEQEKIKQALNRKWDAFERRTSKGCREFVQEQLPKLKTLIEAQDPNAVSLAREIVDEVDKESYRAQVTYILFLVVALAMIAGSITGIILASGPLAPAICFCVGALLWLTVDSQTVNQKVTLLFWDIHRHGWQKAIEWRAEDVSKWYESAKAVFSVAPRIDNLLPHGI